MSAELVPNSDEWRAARRKFMGASDAPVAMGMSRYRSPVELATEKRQARLGLGGMPEPTTPDQARGHSLEPVGALLYVRKTGSMLYESRHCIHPDHSWMAATPDRFIGAFGLKHLLEIKTHNRYLLDQYGDEGSDEIPDYEFVQVHHQMAVTGAPWVDVAVLFGEVETLALLARMVDSGVSVESAADIASNLDFKVYRVNRDETFITTLIAAEEEFWNRYVLGDETPQDIRTMTPRDKIITANGDQAQVIAGLCEAWKMKERGAERYDEQRAKVEEIIGENSGVESAFGRVTWKKSKDSTATVIDHEKIQLDLLAMVATATGRAASEIEAELLAKHTKIISKPGSRRFLVPAAWKKEL